MRTVVILTAFVVVALVGFAGTSLGSSSFPHGDIDCDGDRDSVDALRILRDVAGLQSVPDGCQPGPTPVPGLGRSRDNPVPMGQAYTVPEGWQITILDFTPDGTQQVLDENQFNDPPAPGKRFSIVKVRTKNISAGNPANHDTGFAFRMVGSENIGYSTFEASCGVIPDSFTFKPDDLFEGGSLEGNICYETKIGETAFTIYTRYFLSEDEDTRWFEVK